MPMSSACSISTFLPAGYPSFSAQVSPRAGQQITVRANANRAAALGRKKDFMNMMIRVSWWKGGRWSERGKPGRSAPILSAAHLPPSSNGGASAIRKPEPGRARTSFSR